MNTSISLLGYRTDLYLSSLIEAMNLLQGLNSMCVSTYSYCIILHAIIVLISLTR